MIANTPNTNFNDTGLSANTNYVYTVSANDAAGNSSVQSMSVSVTTQLPSDNQAPTTPTNLQGTAVSESRIDLSWTASTDNIGVTSYRIRRNGVTIANTANTNFSDVGLTANTSYDYTVSARDAAGNFSTQSSSVSVVTQQSSDTQAPTTPTNLQGTAVSTSRIDLTWSASTDNVGVTAYDIRRNGVMISNTVSTNFSDTGLTANTSYLYTVSARDAAGNVSAASGSVSVLTPMSPDTQAPTAPTGLQGTAFSSSRIDLTWAASTDNVGVMGYDIQRNGANVGTTTSTDYSDTGLAANTRYTYEIIARDAAGNLSTVSTSVSVTTHTSNANNKKSGGGSMGGYTLLLLGMASFWRRTRRGLRASRSRPNLNQDSIAP